MSRLSKSVFGDLEFSRRPTEGPPYSLAPFSHHLLCLLLRGGSAKEIKVDLEPLVDAGVDGVVLIADLLRCQVLLSGLVFRGRAVLVRPADEQQVPASQATVPGEDVRTQDASDDVTQMGDVVDVWQSTRQQDVTLTLLRKEGVLSL